MDLGNDSGWDDEYLLNCFPRTFIEDNGVDKCLQVLNDICDILKDRYTIRKNIKLIYKYVLIKLIEYFQELYEDYKEHGEAELCEIYFPPLDEDLVRKIYHEFGYKFEKRVEEWNDEENHPEMFIKYCLEDIDGLFWEDVFDDTEIEFIDSLVEQCIDEVEQGKLMTWDLEYYVDLMSRPTKERYLKVKPLLNKIYDQIENDKANQIIETYISKRQKKYLKKEELLNDICVACKDLQKSKKILQDGENNYNTYIRNLLRMTGYDVQDQTLGGESESRKQLGEIDLEIMKTAEIPFAIFEALNIHDSSESQKEYFAKHLKKLLDNYNPMGVPINFLVTYVKCSKKKFDEYYMSYKNFIQEYKVENFELSHIHEHERTENYLYCIECSYMCGKSLTTVYHIFVRINE